MKATAKPGSIVTQSVERVYKIYQRYVTNIQRTSSAAISGGESCINRFVEMLCCDRGRGDDVAPSTRNGAAAYEEELQRTVNNSMVIISYLTQISKGMFLIND